MIRYPNHDEFGSLIPVDPRWANHSFAPRYHSRWNKHDIPRETKAYTSFPALPRASSSHYAARSMALASWA
ncbi:hypothetical protein OIDMADRAFT_20937 [Oidiodendron maius Zn]|uniref:Uncharacterized protein n=1 Tax=Oidiodendron maius (strain Zn) TaxID=913774 RepID=A0A0C3CAT2_OIDMZ|nr:hypothetical protein OIDMADRAFT_20937 [Oidiodendron maius Zn]